LASRTPSISQRRQVGVGEVAVVVRVFLGAHGARLAGVGVEQHGGLLDGVAVLDLLDLPADLVVDRLLHERNEFRFLISRRVPSGAPGLAHRHVGVAAELPSCMLPSQMPIQVTILCSSLA
jgi:hypothetical protein